MKIGIFMDEVIEYDSEKKSFLAIINGKRFEHKRQAGLEKLIAKVKKISKPRGRPRKEPPLSTTMKKKETKKARGRPKSHSMKPKKRRGRPRKEDKGIAGPSLTPADRIKDLDAVDTVVGLLMLKITKYCTAGSESVHASLAGRARVAANFTGQIVKDVINHGKTKE